MSGENLTPQEREFIRLVKARIFAKLTFYEIAILTEIFKPEPDYRQLIDTLRSQQKDNDLVMNDIIGIDATELLEKV